VHDTERVDVDDAVPQLNRVVFDRLAAGNTSVVDEDVQSAPGFGDVARRPLEVFVSCHLQLDLEHLSARGSNLLRGQSDPLAVAPRDRDTPAVAAEEHSERLTGTACRSGDQDASRRVAGAQSCDGP
jgi:hypothetical protein